jgi:hypothetical protein
MMQQLIELAKTAEDERVRSVCLVAVLDRAGLRPIDINPFPDNKPSFDPGAYTADELIIIKRALRLIKERRLHTGPERPASGTQSNRGPI